MATPSKEDQVVRLFMENSPLRQWHFGEVVREVGITRAAANKWLRNLMNEGFLRQVKEKGRFPYFTCGSNNLAYQSRKRIYALEQLHSSGLASHLAGLKKAKAVIIFGSIARGDWYKDSDIDIFIYGSPEGIKKHEYEQKLRRKIELHTFESKEDIKSVRTGLINNIINGYIIKGQVQDFARVA